MSSVNSATAPAPHKPVAQTQQVSQSKVDSDGDHDVSKAGAAAKSKPVSATIGNNINTTA
jgi:hypothetical protein